MDDWKQTLSDAYKQVEKTKQEKQEQHNQAQVVASNFITETVVPALEELKTELEKHGRDVKLYARSESGTIVVEYKGETELLYTFKVLVPHLIPEIEIEALDSRTGRRFRGSGSLRSGLQGYKIDTVTKEEIIKHFLSEYTRQVKSKL